MKKENLKNYILKNNGASLNIETLEKITYNTGYMVSLESYETTTRNIDRVLNTIYQYQKQFSNINDKEYYIGVWYDKGTYYIDISKRITNKRKAVQFGKDNKQKAIYNLASGKSINLNYNIDIYTLYKKVESDIIPMKQFDTIKEIMQFLKCSRQNVYDYINGINENYIIYHDVMSIKEL